MADVQAWNALAKLHDLNAFEVETLMTCAPTRIAHQHQLDDAARSVREARAEGDHERLSKVLCVLLRAELCPRLICGTLSVATLSLGLEREERVTPDMAVAVRLARVLACKLERVYTFARLFQE